MYKRQVYTKDALYFKLTSGWSAGDTAIKLNGKKGIEADMVVNIVDAETLQSTAETQAFMTNEVVATIGSLSSERDYSITMDNAISTSSGNTSLTDADATSGKYYVEVKKADSSSIDSTARGQAVCYPVDRFKGWLTIEESRTILDPKRDKFQAAGKNIIAMVFEPLVGAPESTVTDQPFEHYDYVMLAISPGKQLDVIKDVTRAINGNRNTNDGFISVFDDIMKDSVSQHILAVYPQLSVA